MPLELMKDREVAAMLSIAVSTVWDYASNGVIPKPLKIGGSTRWVRDEIEIVLQEHIDTLRNVQ
ncbi:transcriptional regulator, AlpA family [Shimia gijangensis]|uniref:Transcriptional regulator, AlpA family n=1 Tax=Shimia gijangensis TaxID=1470563 RepID=A0A1M6S1I4_9RHOB|nr:helix-turn-helix domain-containing protein [Shimia gijangensis]SHK38545.1 transcriptional regulator, AlpA family [Shimia gijangensis]